MQLTGDGSFYVVIMINGNGWVLTSCAPRGAVFMPIALRFNSYTIDGTGLYEVDDGTAISQRVDSCRC